MLQPKESLCDVNSQYSVGLLVVECYSLRELLLCKIKNKLIGLIVTQADY